MNNAEMIAVLKAMTEKSAKKLVSTDPEYLSELAAAAKDFLEKYAALTTVKKLT